MLRALAGVTAAGATEPAAAGGPAGGMEAVDAEMLGDLDLLESPDHARDLEVARRLRVLERPRVEESARAGTGPAPGSREDLR